MAKEKYSAMIHESIEEVMNLYHINTIQRCIPKHVYEDNIVELLVEICDNAIDYGLCIGQYGRRKEQFERYKWHLAKIGFNYHTIFKIISEVYKMLDDDEYFWNVKEDK